MHSCFIVGLISANFIPFSHVAVPAAHAIVPSRHVHLGHTHVKGTGRTVNAGSTFSSSVSHSKAADSRHKHVHNDIVHLGAHHHDHTNLHKVRDEEIQGRARPLIISSLYSWHLKSRQN